MRITAHEVARFVADQHGVTFDDFRSECRRRPIARPRQIAMYAIKNLCPHMSYPAVGRLLGGRDHTTVLHGVRKIEELLATDGDVAYAVTRVMGHFNAPRPAPERPVAPASDAPAVTPIAFQALCYGYGRALGLAA